MLASTGAPISIIMRGMRVVLGALELVGEAPPASDARYARPVHAAHHAAMVAIPGPRPVGVAMTAPQPMAVRRKRPTKGGSRPAAVGADMASPAGEPGLLRVDRQRIRRPHGHCRREQQDDA